MTGYLVNFSVYTLAMVGIIFAALFIFKFVSSGRAFSKKSSFLNIEETMSLSARKNLYVINAGGERFLVASDIDRTSLLAKLDNNSQPAQKITREDTSFELNSLDGIESMSDFSSVADFTSMEDFASVIDIQKGKTTKGPMMKELARKLSMI